MSELFAVVGTPIGHSLSPRIHNAIFVHEGRDAVMGSIDPGSTEGFCTLITAADSGRYTGMAVTAPYKREAATGAETQSDTVQATGVANTLVRTDEGWAAHNTDVPGFLTALTALVDPLEYRTFLVFGTGGTAHSIVYALCRVGAARVSVVGREIKRTQKFCAMFADADTEVFAVATAPGKRVDCAIDATSLGFNPHDNVIFPLSWFEEYAGTVFDVAYTSEGTTKLVGQCRERGIEAIDGREMLYAQAVEQALLWGATSSREELRRVVRAAADVS
ncbi:MAG: hypothetical protein FWG78_00475 [Coriobacteriia bacterium]|nr:hypothetical protein [Coriobacteriia bacterium]